MFNKNNQITYSGFFKNGLLEGQGVVEDRIKNIRKRGNFKAGKLCGQGEWTDGKRVRRGEYGPAG
jgi:hypothetical protein